MTWPERFELVGPRGALLAGARTRERAEWERVAEGVRRQADEEARRRYWEGLSWVVEWEGNVCRWTLDLWDDPRNLRGNWGRLEAAEEAPGWPESFELADEEPGRPGLFDLTAAALRKRANAALQEKYALEGVQWDISWSGGTCRFDAALAPMAGSAEDRILEGSVG